MMDLQRFKNLAKDIGTHFEVEPHEDGYRYFAPDIPKGILKNTTFTGYFLGAELFFDKNGRYLGAVVGDEQPMWESRGDAS